MTGQKTSVELSLPFPPSVNSLYSTNWKTKKRFKSERYETWIKCAINQIPGGIAGTPLLQGKMIAIYEFGRPDKRRRDVANYEKAVSDLLTYMFIINDDSLIEEITLKWADVEGVRVTLTEIGGMTRQQQSER